MSVDENLVAFEDSVAVEKNAALPWDGIDLISPVEDKVVERLTDPARTATIVAGLLTRVLGRPSVRVHAVPSSEDLVWRDKGSAAVRDIDASDKGHYLRLSPKGLIGAKVQSPGVDSQFEIVADRRYRRVSNDLHFSFLEPSGRCRCQSLAGNRESGLLLPRIRLC
jgi:hypothetical protein